MGLTELPKCPVCLERMVSRLDDFLSGFHVMSSPLKLSVEGDKVSQFLIPSVLSIIIILRTFFPHSTCQEVPEVEICLPHHVARVLNCSLFSLQAKEKM